MRDVSDRDGTRLGREFFARDSDAVAYDLVGSLMRVRGVEGDVLVQILEVEAYGGYDDAASHAFAGPTPRCRVMFGPPGHLYVYRIYGLHWCMNVVTGDVGVAGAVLLRAATLRRWSRPGDGDPPAISFTGPGNLTRALAITGEDDGVDCCGGDSERIVFCEDPAASQRPEVSVSGRVGVTRNVGRQSRFFIAGHREVSRFVPGRSHR